eukprot:721526-Prymnesium_polylepis.1
MGGIDEGGGGRCGWGASSRGRRTSLCGHMSLCDRISLSLSQARRGVSIARLVSIKLVEEDAGTERVTRAHLLGARASGAACFSQQSWLRCGCALRPQEGSGRAQHREATGGQRVIAAQDGYRRATGECSPGAQQPTRYTQPVTAVRHASSYLPQTLLLTLLRLSHRGAPLHLCCVGVHDLGLACVPAPV